MLECFGNKKQGFHKVQSSVLEDMYVNAVVATAK